MTVLFWFLLVFGVLVFAILIFELKKAPIIDPSPDEINGNSINNRLRDYRAVRDLRAQKFEETKQ